LHFYGYWANKLTKRRVHHQFDIESYVYRSFEGFEGEQLRSPFFWDVTLRHVPEDWKTRFAGI
jgi:hypothetical protein